MFFHMVYKSGQIFLRFVAIHACEQHIGCAFMLMWTFWCVLWQLCKFSFCLLQWQAAKALRFMAVCLLSNPFVRWHLFCVTWYLCT